MKYVSILLLLVGCGVKKLELVKYPTYACAYNIDVISEVDKDRISKFVTETVAGATHQLTTVDYEDVDDTIEVASYQATRIFKTVENGIRIQQSGTHYDYAIIPKSRLSSNQMKIFYECGCE